MSAPVALSVAAAWEATVANTELGHTIAEEADMMAPVVAAVEDPDGVMAPARGLLDREKLSKDEASKVTKIWTTWLVEEEANSTIRHGLWLLYYYPS